MRPVPRGIGEGGGGGEHRRGLGLLAPTITRCTAKRSSRLGTKSALAFSRPVTSEFDDGLPHSSGLYDESRHGLYRWAIAVWTAL